jgi:hypothetical protein
MEHIIERIFSASPLRALDSAPEFQRASLDFPEGRRILPWSIDYRRCDDAQFTTFLGYLIICRLLRNCDYNFNYNYLIDAQQKKLSNYLFDIIDQLYDVSQQIDTFEQVVLMILGNNMTTMENYSMYAILQVSIKQQGSSSATSRKKI